MKNFFVVIIVVSLFSILGCQKNDVTVENTVSKNPTAEEILDESPNSDIFQLNDIIYRTNIKWVNGLEVTRDKQVGEIKTILPKNASLKDFDNGYATLLPEGTKIFDVKERDDVLIVDVNGEIKKYFALTEG